MRKTALILALILVVSMCAACGNEADSIETTQTTVETTEENVVRISVSKDSLTDAEGFIKRMEKYGAEVSDLSDDKGYLFVFSESEHKKLLEDKRSETINKFKEYEDDESHYIDRIEYDDDFRNMTFYVDRVLYDTNSNTTSCIVVAASALSYQLYLEDGQKTTVQVVYSDNEEVINSFTLPMNLNVEQ